MTREVGVGSAYAGLQRARERGNVCVCLCYSEIGEECLSGVVYKSVCVLVHVCLTQHTPCGKAYISEEFGSIIWLTYVSLHIGRQRCQGSEIF